jgi:hypothetical protein
MSGFLTGRTSLTTVQTADIAANAVDGTLTKDALVGDYSDVTITAADLIMYGDATDSNNTKRDTVQGVLDLVTGGVSTTLTSEQATTSGSSVTFSSIPTGCFKIEVLFENVSHNTSDATNFHSIQIGDSGGIETSGYVGGSHGFVVEQTRHNSTSTAGFAIDSNYGAAVAFRGFLTLILKDSTNNTWVASGAMGGANDMTVVFWGTKSLSAELTQLKFLTPDTLDLGDMAIRYYV